IISAPVTTQIGVGKDRSEVAEPRVVETDALEQLASLRQRLEAGNRIAQRMGVDEDETPAPLEIELQALVMAGKVLGVEDMRAERLVIANFDSVVADAVRVEVFPEQRKAVLIRLCSQIEIDQRGRVEISDDREAGAIALKQSARDQGVTAARLVDP